MTARRSAAAVGLVLALALVAAPASAHRAVAPFSAPVRTLDGSRNNLVHPA